MSAAATKPVATPQAWEVADRFAHELIHLIRMKAPHDVIARKALAVVHVLGQERLLGDTLMSITLEALQERLSTLATRKRGSKR